MATASQVDSILETARNLGYRWQVRHQPAVENEFPDWIVVITTPDGRTLFPSAVDDTEPEALQRAAARIAQDLAAP
ncbi:MAG: hypothetical protein QM655_06385 [Nocardioidaceae bacterium]